MILKRLILSCGVHILMYVYYIRSCEKNNKYTRYIEHTGFLYFLRLWIIYLKLQMCRFLQRLASIRSRFLEILKIYCKKNVITLLLFGSNIITFDPPPKPVSLVLLLPCCDIEYIISLNRAFSTKWESLIQISCLRSCT